VSAADWEAVAKLRAGCVYNNMPPFGLGLAGHLVAAQGRRMSAKGRLGLPDTNEERPT
jgi:hypothetical protein